MFRGVFEHSMDEKGRLSLPARFKESLLANNENAFILTANIENCLLGYPLSEWEVMEKKILELPTFDKAANLLRRLFLAPASECTIDKNGRFLIPLGLRERIHLNEGSRSTVFAGMTNKFELWAQPAWNEMMTILMADDQLEQMKDLVTDLNI